MTNIDRIAAHIAKHGGKNMLIHPVPGTALWLVMEKIAIDQWAATLLNPMQHSRYGFGIISDAQHVKLWMELVMREIELRSGPRALRAGRDPPS